MGQLVLKSFKNFVKNEKITFGLITLGTTLTFYALASFFSIVVGDFAGLNNTKQVYQTITLELEALSLEEADRMIEDVAEDIGDSVIRIVYYSNLIEGRKFDYRIIGKTDTDAYDYAFWGDCDIDVMGANEIFASAMFDMKEMHAGDQIYLGETEYILVGQGLIRLSDVVHREIVKKGLTDENYFVLTKDGFQRKNVKVDYVDIVFENKIPWYRAWKLKKAYPVLMQQYFTKKQLEGIGYKVFEFGIITAICFITLYGFLLHWNLKNKPVYLVYRRCGCSKKKMQRILYMQNVMVAFPGFVFALIAYYGSIDWLCSIYHVSLRLNCGVLLAFFIIVTSLNYLSSLGEFRKATKREGIL